MNWIKSLELQIDRIINVVTSQALSRLSACDSSNWNCAQYMKISVLTAAGEKIKFINLFFSFFASDDRIFYTCDKNVNLLVLVQCSKFSFVFAVVYIYINRCKEFKFYKLWAPQSSKCLSINAIRLWENERANVARYTTLLRSLSYLAFILSHLASKSKAWM